MELIKANQVEELIFTIRDKQFMLDYHLADVYQVQTKRLNEQVKRNKVRFAQLFMFQLAQEEWNALQSQIATSKVLAVFEVTNCDRFKYSLGNG